MEKRQILDAVAKLITQTQEGAIRWTPVSPSLVAVRANGALDQPYVCEHLGQRLLIYRIGPPGSDLSWALGGKTNPEKMTAVLEFVDGAYKPSWVFPQNDALKDLYNAVQFQVIGVQSFFDRLLEE